jgi:hypothetical protein
MQDSWPSAEQEAERASPLPRVEDLPYAERGYDPERVREAFDAFYRHLARLDATLRTIEAVDVFRGQADELRKELRALRTAGWTQQPWLPSYATRERTRPAVPETVFRWALEACFVIAVPVAASVADLRSRWIIAAAAGAFLIVAITEWAASRERDVFPAPVPAPAAPPAPAAEEPEPVPLPPAEPAPGEATEWNLPPPVEAADLERGPEQQEELTVVGEAQPAEAAEPELLEPEPELLEPEPEPEPEPVAAIVVPAAEQVVAEPEEEAAEAAAEPEPPPAPPEEPAAEAAPMPEVAQLPMPPAAPAAEEPEPPPRRRRFRWRRERAADEQGELEPSDARPRHVRVLPAEAESRVEPLDPWEEELDVEPEAEHEATPRG